MGSGSFTPASYRAYSASTGYDTKPIHEVFSQQKIKDAMDPRNITLRESCDSDEHPLSTPIILGLDVTGSMGRYAHEIAVTHLPKLMSGILDSRPVPDPQMMFMGLDDVHASSPAALQVSQFESDIRILEQLRDIYIVGRGGGNSSESYDLVWYFAGHRTKIDCYDRRQTPGFIFTFGDEEAPYENMKPEHLTQVFGPGQYQEVSPRECLALAQQRYQVFHVVIEQGSYYRSDAAAVRRSWTQLMGNNVLFLRDSIWLSDVVLATLQVASGQDINDVINQSVCPDELRHAFSNCLG